jgi:hypothetical protein
MAEDAKSSANPDVLKTPVKEPPQESLGDSNQAGDTEKSRVEDTPKTTTSDSEDSR